MYLTILNIATILGGITSLWFLWDKRRIILACVKIKYSNRINPLSLGDDEFLFFIENRKLMLNSRYLPKNDNEEEICKSLTNVGVLSKRGGFYKLTSAGRAMACA